MLQRTDMPGLPVSPSKREMRALGILRPGSGGRAAGMVVEESVGVDVDVHVESPSVHAQDPCHLVV